MSTITATRTGTATATRTAAEWVRGFADGWRAPADADSFSDHFEPLLADEMRLVQPQLPEIVGKRAFREDFARPLFSLLSEVRGTVGSWAAREDGVGGEVVFVELTITAKLAGGRPVTLQTIDKVTLRDGVAVERVASLDPLDLLRAIALSPRAWPRFASIQLGHLRERLGR
jgi:ketosteroid isomerase-like protein